MKNVHPLQTARRRAAREVEPPKGGCPFCLEEEHTAGRNHDFQLTHPNICRKHHDQLTEARRDAGISMDFERNPNKRIALALKSESVFLEQLSKAMWRWAVTLENNTEDVRS